MSGVSPLQSAIRNRENLMHALDITIIVIYFLLMLVVGWVVGEVVGTVVGCVVGDVVGIVVGDVVGAVVGTVVGCVVGTVVGDVVGTVVGPVVGTDTVRFRCVLLPSTNIIVWSASRPFTVNLMTGFPPDRSSAVA
jgi:uncharacterized membrane protein (DUF485 family)